MERMKDVVVQATRSAKDDFVGPPTFPMPVKRFLAGNYLQRSDVLLSQTKGSPYSGLIRWTTKSHFSHAAMIFHLRSKEEGFNNTFVIEAGTDGVDLTNLRDYAESSKHIIGIKRLEQSWFGEDIQRLVRGQLLDNIKDEYDFTRVLTLARALLRRMISGNERPFRAKDKARLFLKTKRGALANEFICSGLVQFGYFNAVYKLIRANAKGGRSILETNPMIAQNVRTPEQRGVLHPDALKHVIFRPDLASQIPVDESGRFTSFGAMRDFWNELHATTPKDIEESPHFKWHYLILRGQVHLVGSHEEVDYLIRTYGHRSRARRISSTPAKA